MKYFWLTFNQGEVDSLVADVVDFKGVAADRLCLGEKVTVRREDSYVAVGHAGRSGPPDEVLQTAPRAQIQPVGLLNATM